MEDKIGRYFGLVIGVIIPGFVGLYAVGFFVPLVGSWLGLVAQQSTGVGAFLFALLGSIGMGLFLGGCRALVMDRHFQSPPLDHAKRRDPNTETAYRNIVADHYPYYQFYSGMMFAVGLLYLAWLGTWPSVMRIAFASVLLAGGEVVLYYSAADAIGRFIAKRASLVGTVQERAA